MNSGIAVIFITLAIIVGIIVLLGWISSAAEKERREGIYKKYGQTELAERLVKKMFWVGETREQLKDSFGDPLDIDQKVLKTRKREIWKYVRKGTNRYGLKFTLDNDIVVGWDEKL